MGIIGQGAASVSKDSQSWGSQSKCSYRGDNGRKCGIGWLINDDDYDMVIEDNNINLLLQEGDIVFDGDLSVHFLERLQGSHDFAHNTAELASGGKFITEFKNSMKRLADVYNLEIPE